MARSSKPLSSDGAHSSELLDRRGQAGPSRSTLRSCTSCCEFQLPDTSLESVTTPLLPLKCALRHPRLHILRLRMALVLFELLLSLQKRRPTRSSGFVFPISLNLQIPPVVIHVLLGKLAFVSHPENTVALFLVPC